MRAVALALAVLLALAAAAAPAQAKLDTSASWAMAYLAGHAASAGPLAANVAEAAAANGEDPAAWPSGDPIAARIVVPAPEASNVSLLRPLRALALAGDPRAGPGGELTVRVQERVGPTGYGSAATLNDDAYAILALAAAVPLADDDRFQSMRTRLLEGRHASGGWGWAVGGAPGTDMTGLALLALQASGGVPEDVKGPAAAFLGTTRDADGGFAETPGGARNCESTVWGLRATALLGAQADPDDWDFLLGLQRKDGGFAHVAGGGSDLLCTTEAAGLLGEVAEPIGADDVPGPAFPLLAVLLAAGCAMARPTRLRQP